MSNETIKTLAIFTIFFCAGIGIGLLTHPFMSFVYAVGCGIVAIIGQEK